MIHLKNGDDLLLVLEALSNVHRLKIIAVLSEERQYVSALARKLEMSRPLLYLHLQKLEEANLVSSNLEILESGQSAKFYELNPFDLALTEGLIHQLAPSLTMKKKK